MVDRRALHGERETERSTFMVDRRALHGERETERSTFMVDRRTLPGERETERSTFMVDRRAQPGSRGGPREYHPRASVWTRLVTPVRPRAPGRASTVTNIDTGLLPSRSAGCPVVIGGGQTCAS